MVGKLKVLLTCIVLASIYALICYLLSLYRLDFKPVIIVSMDGVGWQFPGQFANTPNLDFIAKTGVKAKYMKMITPTLTWPNHHTLLTGLYPESHGIISNNFWDPVFKEMFVSDYDCSNYDPKFWSDSEPIWLTLQKQGIDTGVYFWPGFSSYRTKPSYYEKEVCKINCSKIQDLPSSRTPIRASYPPYDHCMIDYSISSRNRIDTVVSWLTSKKPPRFVALYIDQTDWVGHSDGAESQKFKDEIEKVDRDVVGYLVTQLQNVNLLDKVNLIFVADHSFVTIDKSKVIYLEDYLDSSTYMMTEYGPFVHLWPKEGKLDEIYSNLQTFVQRHPQAKVYKKDEIPEEYHYRNNRRIPPIYLDPGFGWLVKETRFNVTDDWVYGTHGYPASEKMASIFYARGPSFKKGYQVNRGLQSIDVYPMMCEILGVEPRPNNGSLANMKEMLIGVDGSTPLRETL